MPIRLLLLILLSVALSAAAQLMLKFGTRLPEGTAARGPAAELGGLLSSPLVLAGLATYGFGAILWLFVLARAPLSLAYPFVGLGFILTMLAGLLVLGEHLSAARIVGTLMIAGGCVLVARSA